MGYAVVGAVHKGNRGERAHRVVERGDGRARDGGHEVTQHLLGEPAIDAALRHERHRERRHVQGGAILRAGPDSPLQVDQIATVVAAERTRYACTIEVVPRCVVRTSSSTSTPPRSAATCGPEKAVTDFTFGLGYGFGYNFTSRAQLMVVQDLMLMVHKRVPGNVENILQQRTLRVGGRFALGSRN